jgi:3-oxoacyl-(acyl-carrier-protein) synthase
MKTNERKLEWFQIIAIILIALVVTVIYNTAEANDIVVAEEQVVESSLWEKTKNYSSEVWDSTVESSVEYWEDTKAYLSDDDNAAWAAITGGGVLTATGGIAATSTATILGLVTITTAPAWAPVAICAGGAVAIAGATHMITKELEDE